MNGGISPDKEPDPSDPNEGMEPGEGGSASWSSMGIAACVPLDSISVEGVPPSKGDTVSFSIGGTVQDVSGTDAMVKITDINGEAVKDTSGSASETTSQMGTRLRGKAAAATDAQNSMYGG